jgi:hypothetical protein
VADPTPYTDALAEVERLLHPTPQPLAGQIGEHVLPFFSAALLRESFGSPDAMLQIAAERVEVAKLLPGPLGRPDLEAALDLLALARHWLRSEAWRPLMVEIRKPTQVQGRRVPFVRATSKRAPWYSRLLRGDGA